MDILFDIGNVLLAFDFKPALDSLIGPNAQPDAYQKIIERKDPFEAGQIPTSEYIAWASEQLDFSGTPEEFMLAWVSIFKPIDPMWDLAHALSAAGHRLILFSNTNPIHAPFCLETYPVFQHFAGAVMSHEIGAIKPHDDFYLRAIEKYQLTPEKTLYIDDLPANIDAGNKHGFQSLIYDFNNQADFEQRFQEVFARLVS